MNTSHCASLTYKRLENGAPMGFFLYPPSFENRRTKVPTIVYFHGGGLTVGNKHSWHPSWLQQRANARGFAFITADYRLMPPATGHSILEDVKDLFDFLAKENIYKAICATHPSAVAASYRFEIDKDAIVVAGSSAGGLCAYLAAIHCQPKPKALFSIYGMGGDFFMPHYLSPKNEVFFRGREVLDPKDFTEFLYPRCNDLEEIADSPLVYHSADYRIPGYPANPRMLLSRLYLQLGVYLDYYTGSHSPSLTETLRPLLSTSSGSAETNALANAVPEKHRCLFPQLQITSDWPCTIFWHGTADTAVPIEDARNLARSLSDAQVNVKFVEFDGEEHSFDYQPNAEEKHGKSFDQVVDILEDWVTK
ncbi:hypothetical protein M378DRAFT_347471 [Amanita muscaria Koide BX008]|uniref:Alpha/beta hydrolase fold-3 domain-containing protein n=1 Tax=Amanita muscaria (strain Koide BX008) TaxID=946122 RepID=A0A0C2XBK1_AMAMK|nr:hypothetical protein M378DRAFT_347471 [Amanita muscaria Koide BX008]